MILDIQPAFPAHLTMQELQYWIDLKLFTKQQLNEYLKPKKIIK